MFTTQCHLDLPFFFADNGIINSGFACSTCATPCSGPHEKCQHVVGVRNPVACNGLVYKVSSVSVVFILHLAQNKNH